MGIVLGELLNSSENLKKAGLKRYLFKGRSCYPISPADVNNHDLVKESD